MKILIAGALGEGALEHYYIRGLKRNNVACDCFDITDAYYTAISRNLTNKVVNKIYPGIFFDPVNRSIKKFIDGKQYDAIIVFKGMALYPETISELKRHTKLLCCYNPDHPFRFYSPGSGNKNVLNSINLYDLYITYAGRIAKELRDSYGVESFVLPFGYDDEVVPSEIPFTKAVGNLSFIGAYDNDRYKILEKIEADNLLVYGDPKWGTRTGLNSKSRSRYTGQSVYGQDYVDIIASSDGVFNFLRQQNLEEGSHNMRTFEVPGYGGLLISNRTEEQLCFFEEDKEAIYFETIEELNDKLKFIKGKDTYISMLKKNARDKSLKAGFGYSQRTTTLLKHLSDLIN